MIIEAEPEAGVALFALIGLRAVAGAPEGAWIDEYGIARAPGAAREPRVYTVQVADEPPPPLAGPGERDLGLPRGADDRFGQVARRWTAGATTTRPGGCAAARLLTSFTYSLELDEVPAGEDPAWFFLSSSRRGHCELFASAFVLMARSLDLPAPRLGLPRLRAQPGRRLVRGAPARRPRLGGGLDRRGTATVDHAPGLAGGRRGRRPRRPRPAGTSSSGGCARASSARPTSPPASCWASLATIAARWSSALLLIRRRRERRRSTLRRPSGRRWAVWRRACHAPPAPTGGGDAGPLRRTAAGGGPAGARRAGGRIAAFLYGNQGDAADRGRRRWWLAR
ncbi:MAG: transglutaminase-like domain-containing protein [bacterium]